VSLRNNFLEGWLHNKQGLESQNVRIRVTSPHTQPIQREIYVDLSTLNDTFLVIRELSLDYLLLHKPIIIKWNRIYETIHGRELSSQTVKVNALIELLPNSLTVCQVSVQCVCT
jgi:hypothetical protein